MVSASVRLLSPVMSMSRVRIQSRHFDVWQWVEGQVRDCFVEAVRQESWWEGSEKEVRKSTPV